MSNRPMYLPPECFPIILEKLADDCELSTLASMLLVSKSMFDMTVPILYRDPFRFFHDQDSSTAASLSKLGRLLLPPKNEPNLDDPLNTTDSSLEDESADETQENSEESSEKAPLPPPTTESPPTPLLRDYLSYLRIIDVTKHHGELFYHAMLKDQGKDLTDEDRAKFAQVFNPLDILMGLVRELVELLAEQVVSITIPLWDIYWHLDQVQRFKSLAHVDFIEFEEEELSLLARTSYNKLCEASSLAQNNLLSPDPISEMELFIVKHVKALPGILKSITCFASKPGGIVDREHPDLGLVKIMKRLPPLNNPRHLDEFSFNHLLAHADKTNLEYVESIAIDLDLGWDIYDLAKNLDPFLEKCRNLKRLSWVNPVPGIFSWAFEERSRKNDAEKKERQDNDEIGSVNQSSSTEDSNHRPRQLHRLVPLESIELRSVSIRGHITESENCELITDLMYCFGHSLKDLSIRIGRYEIGPSIFGLYRTNEMFDNPDDGIKPGIYMGCDSSTPLPYFQRLELFAPDQVCLWLNSEFLNHSPVVSVVVLNPVEQDLGRTIDGTDGDKIAPLQLPELKNLVLKGPPSATFHLNTFESTKQLKTIKLASLPGLKALKPNTRPSNRTAYVHLKMLKEVSWSWHLPQLSTLSLQYSFAHNFKFKMLDSCPSLEELKLVVKYNRTLDVSELYSSGYTDSVTEIEEEKTSARGRRKYVQAPRLTRLTMNGPWTISDETWRVLLKNVAPNVGIMSVEGIKGYDLVKWLLLTTEMNHLESVDLDSPIPPEDMISFADGDDVSENESEYILYEFPSDAKFLKRRFLSSV
ncbi:hypothetical protein BGW38_001961 [Lunasporangiospora selenospora]|uniref:F-box domain-containing protein n=1 Tax=Lunasporangiospora selenospora TaxID=979761 RepID=A0A9P6G2B8_9FUNG|nr:hypothetical protein BGW38_001961 [Lunasporangiospora selenospora]